MVTRGGHLRLCHQLFDGSDGAQRGSVVFILAKNVSGIAPLAHAVGEQAWPVHVCLVYGDWTTSTRASWKKVSARAEHSASAALTNGCLGASDPCSTHLRRSRDKRDIA